MELFRSSYGKAVGTILKNGITEADGISANKPEKLIILTVLGLGLPQTIDRNCFQSANCRLIAEAGRRQQWLSIH